MARDLTVVYNSGGNYWRIGEVEAGESRDAIFDGAGENLTALSVAEGQTAGGSSPTPCRPCCSSATRVDAPGARTEGQQ